MSAIPLKSISNMYERVIAERKADFSYVTRNGMEVYRMELATDNTLSLFHYGTLVLQYDLKEGQVVYQYGQSVSDRDSMNSLLILLGHYPCFHYGSVKGFWKEAM